MAGSGCGLCLLILFCSYVLIPDENESKNYQRWRGWLHRTRAREIWSWPTYRTGKGSSSKVVKLRKEKKLATVIYLQRPRGSQTLWRLLVSRPAGWSDVRFSLTLLFLCSFLGSKKYSDASQNWTMYYMPLNNLRFNHDLLTLRAGHGWESMDQTLHAGAFHASDPVTEWWLPSGKLGNCLDPEKTAESFTHRHEAVGYELDKYASWRQINDI